MQARLLTEAIAKISYPSEAKSNTKINYEELKAGAIITQTSTDPKVKEIYGYTDPNYQFVCHFAIFAPTNELMDGVVHVSFKGLKQLTLHQYHAHVKYLNAETELYIFQPRDEKTGVLVAKQALAWCEQTDAAYDRRKYHIAIQTALLGIKNPFDLLTVLKFALRRDTSYTRATGNSNTARGIHCVEFVINCYNASAVGAFLDEKMKQRFSCGSSEIMEYVSVKYAQQSEGKSHAYLEQKKQQVLRSKMPVAYTQLFPGQTKRIGSSTGIEHTLPCHVDSQNCKDFDKHVKGKSPIEFLPHSLQTEEAMSEIADAAIFRMSAKFATAPVFYSELLKSKYFTGPFNLNSDRLHLYSFDQEKSKKDNEVLMQKHAVSWQRTHVDMIQYTLNKLAKSFLSDLEFKLSAELCAAVEKQDYKKASQFVVSEQARFIKEFKSFKLTTLSTEFNKVLSSADKTEDADFLAQLGTNIPEKGCAEWLSKAISLSPPQFAVYSRLIKMRELINASVICNKYFKDLAYRLQLIAPCPVPVDTLAKPMTKSF